MRIDKGTRGHTRKFIGKLSCALDERNPAAISIEPPFAKRAQKSVLKHARADQPGKIVDESRRPQKVYYGPPRWPAGKEVVLLAQKVSIIDEYLTVLVPTEQLIMGREFRVEPREELLRRKIVQDEIRKMTFPQRRLAPAQQ